MSSKFLTGGTLGVSALVLIAAMGSGWVFAQDSEDTDSALDTDSTQGNSTQGNSTQENSTQGNDIKQGSGTIEVPLSGRGLVSSETSLSVTPTTLDFGTVNIGNVATGTLTLQNNGDVDAPAVLITSDAAMGQSATEFSTDFTSPVSLESGESVEVNVQFAPQTPGDKAAGLRLTIDGATSPYALIYTGKAIYSATSELGSSALKVSLGEVSEGATGKSAFILTNEGDSTSPDIDLLSLSLSGINATEFSTTFFPITLSPGEQLEVEVSVDSSTTGFKTATAEIMHDGNNGSLQIELEASVEAAGTVPVNFSQSVLNADIVFTNATTLQFGPDGKLYVGDMDGHIYILDVTRNAKDDYSATLEETILLIKEVINHNDDGTRDFADKRLMTGFHVVGTASNPVIYAASSDPRQAAGPSGNDSGLDTNSGILHRLTKSNGTWTKLDLVRGLPRSEENHVSNGLVLVDDKIYLNTGGNTNEGLPSNNFAELPEYALSAAVLEIDLAQIGETTYDLPTLDGPNDETDPFGGNDGLNQAILEEDGPVRIFATGFRNAYDIVYSEAGNFYVWDNGPNAEYGGAPEDADDCLNIVKDEGNKYEDGLHLVTEGYYAGHPNPTRGNKQNTFGGQSPIEGDANPIECIFLKPGDAENPALLVHNASTNGMDEYTASNFNGAMQNDLLAIGFDQVLYRVKFNNAGNTVTSKSELATGLGATPLDVTTQSDTQPFPGTIWIADVYGDDVLVLEPSDY